MQMLAKIYNSCVKIRLTWFGKCCVLAVFCVLVNLWFTILPKYGWLAINASHSLPQKLFWVRVIKPHLTDKHYVVFPLQTGDGKSVNLIKKVIGVPGDYFSTENNQYVVNNQVFGAIKTQSSRGDRLEPTPGGVVPAQHYLVWSPHKDSLDSRYRLVGLVHEKNILGVAAPLF